MIPINYNVRSLLIRKTTTVATAFGIALVVFVLASALMLAAGMKKTMATAAKPDHAVVLQHGAETELVSTLETRAANVVLAAPGLKKDMSGTPIGAGELVVAVTFDKVGAEGQVSNIQVRGITEATLKLRSEANVVAGRRPTPGTDEVMIGKGIDGRFRGMAIGQSFELRKNRPVRVVGVFAAGGSSFESEVWADIGLLRSSLGRDGVVSSVTVQLESPEKFDAFKATVEGDRQLGLEASRVSEYYAKQSNGTSTFISAIGAVISVVFSLGAIIGAIITMFSAVSQRRREIGTLRALGFSRASILFSFLLEAVVLALMGGVVGLVGALAMTLGDVSMMNLATWQEVTFGFEPDPAVLLTALVFGCGMGVMGGFLPALRASRLAPIEALRG